MVALPTSHQLRTLATSLWARYVDPEVLWGLSIADGIDLKEYSRTTDGRKLTTFSHHKEDKESVKQPSIPLLTSLKAKSPFPKFNLQPTLS